MERLTTQLVCGAASCAQTSSGPGVNYVHIPTRTREVFRWSAERGAGKSRRLCSSDRCPTRSSAQTNTPNIPHDTSKGVGAKFGARYPRLQGENQYRTNFFSTSVRTCVEALSGAVSKNRMLLSGTREEHPLATESDYFKSCATKGSSARCRAYLIARATCRC